MKRPQMARTLEIIALEGADALYKRTGSLFKDFIRDLQDFGGIITEEDMLNYKYEPYKNFTCIFQTKLLISE